MTELRAIFGIALLVSVCWAISEARGKVRIRGIVVGVTLQVAVAFVLLRLPLVSRLLGGVNRAVTALDMATGAGTAMVFGYLGGGAAPFSTAHPEASFILAFRALPLVLLMSALSSLLFYWRILPKVVGACSRILQRSLGIGGALGVATTVNIFVGMVEAPLCIRPYLGKMSRSELFSVMTCGLATIAGTVFALYAKLLNGVIPDAAGHLLTASVISVPASLTIARVLVPETEATTAGDLVPPRQASSTMDAITHGTIDGLQLLLHIVAMLIVLVALVSLVNQALGLLPAWGGSPLSLQRLLGYVMAPVVWLIGVPWPEAHTAGALMGTKTVLNELLAYLEMAQLPETALGPRSRLIMTYAMCGFANFGSLGIMIGGMGAMAPERRSEIVQLGLKALFAGTVATCMTGAVVGLL